MGVLDDLLHNAILQEKEKHPDMSVADFDRMASKAFEEVLPEFSKGVLASIL